MRLLILFLALAVGIFYAPHISAQDGQALYQSCAACHGVQGQGNKQLFAPPLAGQTASYVQEQLLNYRAGRRGTHADDTHGNIMRATIIDLTDPQIETLSHYIARLPPTPPSHMIQAGNAAQGQQFYDAHCADCHGITGRGNATLYAPNLTILPAWYIRQQVAAYRKGWRGHDTSTTRAKNMRAMAMQFRNDKDIENVITWLSKITHKGKK